MTQADQIRKHSTNCYRITLSDSRFGQVCKNGREWHAEVRRIDDGVLVRFAGIWSTRKDAIDELRSFHPLDM